MEIFVVNTECAFAASPCSNFALLYTFYGITVAISGRSVGYISVVYAILLVLSLFTEFGLGVFDTTVHFVLGLVSGLTISSMLRTVLIAPLHILEHKYQLVLYFVELAVAALIFIFVDDIVPEHGFPRGLWMALLWYLLWFGTVYFINFKYGSFERKSKEDVVWYTRTYLYWGLAMLPYFATASLTFLNRYITGVLATFIILLTVAFYRFLAHRGPAPHYK